MKEIIGQEIEFKMKHYEEAFLKKKRDIEEELVTYKEEFIQIKEQELKAVIANDRAKIQQEKVRNHAQATQVLYDDINLTLEQKYAAQTKAKLNTISEKLKANFSDKIKQLDQQKEAFELKDK